MIVTKQHVRYGCEWVNLMASKYPAERKFIKVQLNRMARRVANMEAQRIEIDDVEYFIDVKEYFIGRIV